ncbi:MAG: 4-hydroxy-tetrahydrodipicolinate synthase [Candidatus Kapaibacteriota bacterium]
MMTLPLTGTITALVTPMHKDGSIDVESLKKLIDFQLAGNISAIVPCGSTGESATMSFAEKCEVIRITVEHTSGRVPVIAGTGSNDTAAAIALTQEAKSIGADAVLLVSPFYNKPTQRGLIAHFSAIAESCDIPQILYNVPGRTASNVTAETQLQLAETYTHIIATKEASADLEQMMEIIKHRPAHFTLLAGDDSLALPIIAAGGHGVISVLSNYAPAQFGACINAALSGDFEKARSLHYTLFDLMRLNFIETNPIPVKGILSMLGICQENYRLPMQPLLPENKEKLRLALIQAGIL